MRRNLKKGSILASNHVSYMDWLVLFVYLIFYHDIRIVFIAKDKLFSRETSLHSENFP